MTIAIVSVERRETHYEIAMYMGPGKWIMSENTSDQPIRFETDLQAHAAIKHMIDLNLWSGSQLEDGLYRIEL